MAAKRKTTASSGDVLRGGVKRPRVVTGAADPIKARIARVSTTGGGGGRERQAGMFIDTLSITQPYQTGYRLNAYYNSYANGLQQRSGTYDIPTYFVQMNEQNGGILYWPVTLAEKYSWYRYWARCFTNPNVLITKSDGTESPLYSFKPGDKVINRLGSITEIDEVTTQNYEGDVFRFEVEANRWNDIEVTPEHPFYILRSENVKRHHHRVFDEQRIEHRETRIEIDYKPEWMEAKDIRVGDMMIVPSTEKSSLISMSVERARLLGYYASEGNISFDKKGKPQAVTWSLGTHERELLDEIKELCFAEVGKIPSEYNYDKRSSVTSLRLWDRDFAVWMLENCGKGSHSKKFSKLVFNADDESVKNIIGCWFNGDGCRDNNGAEGQIDGVTFSGDMAHQLFLMMVRIGLAPSKRIIQPSEFGNSSIKMGKSAWRIFLPPMYANQIVAYFKWDGCRKNHRHHKYNYAGNMLLPVRDIFIRKFDGLIWNLSTKGETYDERTFLVYGMVTHNTDSYIGRALDLLSDLPMSKLTLNMPKMKGKEALRDEILEFFQYQCDTLNIFQLCQDILSEVNMLGNTYLFHEWNEEKKMWSRVVFLPPEEVFIFQYPYSENKRVEYRPMRLISLIKGERSTTGGTDDITNEILDNVPEEIVEMVKTHGCILMDSDPMSGSFIYQIARRKHPYYDLGASILERVLVPMLQKEHYRYTQLSLASRNMTPKNLITAPGLLPGELDTLRSQVDLSYLDPDYSIITNYEVTWQQIGAQDRLLDLDREYERIENQVFAALGVTRELLTGEGTFAGNRITVEILNTMFLMSREVLKNYIEKTLFMPVAEKRGWFETSKNGIKKYFYPQISFNRLTIRDNAEVFDSLYQLYQKGSLPVEVIYELFNLNPDDMTNKIHGDLFTVKDATFNRLVEMVNTEVGRALVDNSDLAERISKYLGLKLKTAGGEDGGIPPDGGDVGPSLDEPGTPPETQPEVQPESQPEVQSETPPAEGGDALDKLTQTIAEEMPPHASDKDISEIVQDVVGGDKPT